MHLEKRTTLNSDGRLPLEIEGARLILWAVVENGEAVAGRKNQCEGKWRVDAEAGNRDADNLVNAKTLPVFMLLR